VDGNLASRSGVKGNHKGKEEKCRAKKVRAGKREKDGAMHSKIISSKDDQRAQSEGVRTSGKGVPQRGEKEKGKRRHPEARKGARGDGVHIPPQKARSVRHQKKGKGGRPENGEGRGRREAKREAQRARMDGGRCEEGEKHRNMSGLRGGQPVGRRMQG